MQLSSTLTLSWVVVVVVVVPRVVVVAAVAVVGTIVRKVAVELVELKSSEIRGVEVLVLFEAKAVEESEVAAVEIKTMTSAANVILTTT